ncbi:MAG: prepilin-type N-terminal cleavage/methylation domain-containing protein [Candidatus Omnitrophota bacterium]|nr:MAG: prepilin-type N-terminal cleavage/methylation domain-containing protein [Candidatus Omnitrophota bacterium]
MRVAKKTFLIIHKIIKEEGMKRGFTLMELIIVIIILGVLATIGFTQYQRVVEKGRTSEAKTVLGQLRTAQEAYRLEHDGYTPAIDELGVSAPVGCVSTHYFQYRVDAAGPGNFVVTAERCVGGGKTPQSTLNYLISLDESGAFTGEPGYI